MLCVRHAINEEDIENTITHGTQTRLKLFGKEKKQKNKEIKKEWMRRGKERMKGWGKEN